MEISVQRVIDQFVKPEWKDVAELVANAARLEERERLTMKEKDIVAIAYAALASVDSPRNGVHMEYAVRAVSKQIEAILSKREASQP